MTTDEYLIAIALVVAGVMAYFVYWLGWCWAWYVMWPTAPHWFARPTFFGFLLTSVFAVFITLVILRANG